jgi:hypothetical protein
MMKATFKLAIVGIVVALATSLLGQKGDRRSASSNCELLGCVTSLELPRFTNGLDLLWLGGKNQATVQIVFEIGRTGLAENIRIDAPTQMLSNITLTRMSDSRFKTSCAGSRISLTYEYEVFKLPVALDLPAVTILEGNRINLKFPVRQPSEPLKEIPRL